MEQDLNRTQIYFKCKKKRRKKKSIDSKKKKSKKNTNQASRSRKQRRRKSKRLNINPDTPNNDIKEKINKKKVKINTNSNFQTDSRLHSREFYWEAEDFAKMKQEKLIKRVLVIGPDHPAKTRLMDILMDKHTDSRNKSTDDYISSGDEETQIDTGSSKTVHKSKFFLTDLGRGEDTLRTMFINCHLIFDKRQPIGRLEDVVYEDLAEKLKRLGRINMLLVIVPWEAAELKSFRRLVRKITELDVDHKSNIVFAYLFSEGTEQAPSTREASKKLFKKVYERLKEEGVEMMDLFRKPLDLQIVEKKKLEVKKKELKRLATAIRRSERFTTSKLRTMLSQSESE